MQLAGGVKVVVRVGVSEELASVSVVGYAIGVALGGRGGGVRVEVPVIVRPA